MRILKGFENLRRLEVVDRLLIDPTTYKGYRFDEFDRCTFGVADWIDFVASLPSTLETLTIYFLHERSFEHEVQGLVKQLSLLVAAKSSDQFSNLCEICIGNILSRSLHNHGFADSAGPRIMRPVNLDPWYLDLRNACDAKGILLHSNPPDDPDSDATCPSCQLFPSKDGTESLPKYCCA